MRLTFVSNYINHHQLPVSRRLSEYEGVEYTFVQTEELDEERARMGWGQEPLPDYVVSFNDDPDKYRKLIMDSDYVIFGGTDDEDYIMPRLEAGKCVIRYSERIYKSGQWKFISPRGLKKKYHDHVRFNNSKVYLLCAGGYVASDFNLIHAYPGKKYVWGYFPEFQNIDIDEIIANKNKHDKVKLLWSGRMIDWKHPEDVIDVACGLREKNISFELNIIGNGPLKDGLVSKVNELELNESVIFHDFMKPEEVRSYMLDADIYLFTSDYKEGWGAVLNESMNSGCAVIASSGIGAVPYLIKHRVNGYCYKNGNKNELVKYAIQLATDKSLRNKIQKEAFNTISSTWNPDEAARRLMQFVKSLDGPKLCVQSDGGPLSMSPDISPRKGYEYVAKSR